RRGAAPPSRRRRPRRRSRPSRLPPWGLEQLQVLGALPVRDRVREPGQLVSPHRRIRGHELFAEEILRRRLLLERFERLLERDRELLEGWILLGRDPRLRRLGRGQPLLDAAEAGLDQRRPDEIG